MNETLRQSLHEGERAGSRYALRLPRHAGTGQAGAVEGIRAGSSLEFLEHREYHPGDDLRHVDWSALARSGKLVVKRFREEIRPHVDILVDASRSMALPGSSKARATLGLAAAVAAAAGNAGLSHGAWRAGTVCEPVANGTQRPSAWTGLELDAACSPADSLARLPPAFRPRTIRVLCSDLLFPGEPMTLLGLLGHQAAAVFVIQVLARSDIEPPQQGYLRLIDAETGLAREMLLDSAALARYRQALARHQDNWSRACRQTGATLATVVAENLVQDWSFEPLITAALFEPARRGGS